MPTNLNRRLLILLAFVLAIAGCTSDDGTPSTTTTSEVATTAVSAPASPTQPPDADHQALNLVLMWHQHQPLYPKDADGYVSRPWARLHATKDYYDMAALLADYPDVHATFNLTPVLMRQLEELTQGAKDIYWAMTEIPADQLQEEERTFVIERFFDTNAKIVARFPRYQELIEKRDQPDSFTVDELRDLQVLFNLAWTDPSFLAEEPLAALVGKGRDFSEDDKATVLAEHSRIIAEVLPLHRRLWDSGQIEVTTTPFAHPILPLLTDTDLALVGDPTGLRPVNRYRQPADAVDQVRRGLNEAERQLGRRPVGMWPGEGSVAQDVMGMFASNGVDWVATGEDVLAQTLGIGSFERGANDLVAQSDVLYQMHQAQVGTEGGLPMFFRDDVLSDLIGFEYCGTPADFMSRLADINEALEGMDIAGPKVVSVILDGENAWEHYDNDGIDFLNALYRRLSESDFVRTVTPSELLELYPSAPQPLPDIFPGAWFQPNFATWIGEPEEAQAWDYLFQARSDLGTAQRRGDATDTAIADAYETMLFAEGSDWFWWYGADQDSGNDGYFDRAFRELLGQVYDALGLERPDYVQIPIIPHPTVEPARGQSELVTIVIDDIVATEAWAVGGRYELAGGSVVDALDYAFDKENLYVRVTLGPDGTGGNDGTFDLYLGVPTAIRAYGLTEGGAVLGFNASHRLSWSAADPRTVVGPYEYSKRGADDAETVATPAGFDGEAIEFAIPIESLPAISAGDRINLRVIETGATSAGTVLPGAGPGYIRVPDISNVEVVLAAADPTGDDHGPGTYTYPQDSVFSPGSYDLTGFSVGLSGDDMVVFDFEVAAPIGNPWGSPVGYSIQTFDLYIDEDPGAATGARLLLPGRNAALETDIGWEYALTLEGWFPALYLAQPDGSIEETEPRLPGGGQVVSVPGVGGGDPSPGAQQDPERIAMGEDLWQDEATDEDGAQC